MKNISFLILFFFSVFKAQPQDYLVSFNGNGAIIDSVRVNNLTQGKGITLNGTDALRLKAVISGINPFENINKGVLNILPNPTEGTTRAELFLPDFGTCKIKIADISGRTLAFWEGHLRTGWHSFSIQGLCNGFYFIVVDHGGKSLTGKISSIFNGADKPALDYLGILSDKLTDIDLKSQTVERLMQYTAGDLLKFTFYSGTKKTIITDIPTQSKTITASLYQCTDPAGRSYAAVKIGSQWWMAENLAWLPSVSPSGTGSVTEKHYYVYSYSGSETQDAKVTANFKTYGVLYNGTAALNGLDGNDASPSGIKGACPDGWYLPGDAEWKQMEIALGLSKAETEAEMFRGSDQGNRLKNSTGWTANGNGTNVSGFSALPGGFYSGNFGSAGSGVTFWSSRTKDTDKIWVRTLNASQTNIFRGNIPRSDACYIRCVKEIGLAQVTTTGTASVTVNSALLGGIVNTDNGFSVTERGVCWATTPNPFTSGSKMAIGTGTGTFSSTVSGFSTNTTYYARAYAINSQGIAYGQDINFTTSALSLPVVSTKEAANITNTSAILGGKVTGDGGSPVTERGVCWGKFQNPTVSENRKTMGTGIGTFSETISGFNENTTYYARAYAINAGGTAYGNQIFIITSTGTGTGAFTDSRDSKTYNWAKIGNQTWMAENLTYLPAVSPANTGSETDKIYYVYGYNGTDPLAAKATANFKTYGVLYNWIAAIDGAASSNAKPSGVQGVCPGGWHLPSDAEWEQLAQYISDTRGPYTKTNDDWADVGTHLKAKSGWYTGMGQGNGTDDFLFTALGGGTRDRYGNFSYLTENGYWWSATSGDLNTSWYRLITFFSGYLNKMKTYKNYGKSIRCIKD